MPRQGSGCSASGGEYLLSTDEASLTFCCAAWFLTGCRLVLVQCLGGGNASFNLKAQSSRKLML